MSLQVVSVRWLSKEAEEAQVEVAGDGLSFVAFSQPCTATVGDAVEELFAFDVRGLQVTEASAPSVATGENGLESAVVAAVASVKPPVVNLCGTGIVLDVPLPGDVAVGQWVEFSCERLDL